MNREHALFSLSSPSLWLPTYLPICLPAYLRICLSTCLPPSRTLSLPLAPIGNLRPLAATGNFRPRSIELATSCGQRDSPDPPTHPVPHKKCKSRASHQEQEGQKPRLTGRTGIVTQVASPKWPKRHGDELVRNASRSSACTRENALVCCFTK